MINRFANFENVHSNGHRTHLCLLHSSRVSGMFMPIWISCKNHVCDACNVQPWLPARLIDEWSCLLGLAGRFMTLMHGWWKWSCLLGLAVLGLCKWPPWDWMKTIATWHGWKYMRTNLLESWINDRTFCSVGDWWLNMKVVAIGERLLNIKIVVCFSPCWTCSRFMSEQVGSSIHTRRAEFGRGSLQDWWRMELWKCCVPWLRLKTTWSMTWIPRLTGQYAPRHAPTKHRPYTPETRTKHHA